jgi:hypothetical protein
MTESIRKTWSGKKSEKADRIQQSRFLKRMTGFLVMYSDRRENNATYSGNDDCFSLTRNPETGQVRLRVYGVSVVMDDSNPNIFEFESGSIEVLEVLRATYHHKGDQVPGIEDVAKAIERFRAEGRPESDIKILQDVVNKYRPATPQLSGDAPAQATPEANGMA